MYEVKIKTISDHPIVSGGDVLSQEVLFSVDPLDGQVPIDFGGKPVSGEELRRCFALREKGGIKIERSFAWHKSGTPEGLQEVVDEALDRAISESA
jgi:hypothetical protein